MGPRPEIPRFVNLQDAVWRAVLQVKPGITDQATLVYRHEEEILADHGDPEQFYRAQILPDKLAQNRAYLKKITLWRDIRIVIKTISSSFLFSDKRHKRPRF